MIHRLASILGALAVALLAAGPARAVSYGDVEVTIVSVPRGNASHGYNEYQFAVVNRSLDRTHEVRLELPKTLNVAHQDHIRALTRAVTVAPGASVRIDLLQPAYLALYGEGVSVFVDGQKQEDALRLPFSSHGIGTGARGYTYGRPAAGLVAPLVLVSPTCRAFLHQAEEASEAAGKGALGGMLPGGMVPGAIPPPGMVPVMPGGKAGGMPREMRPHRGVATPNAQFIRAELAAPAWNDNWLNYARYDGVVVTADELRAPSGSRTALWQYAECGGVLLILGDPGKILPASWRQYGPPENGFTRYEAGFGTCLVHPGAIIANWDLLNDAWKLPGTPWHRVRSIADANNVFPVVDDIGIPVRSLLGLMIAFVILIGPVNFWVLARLQRRIWMLWTVPVISLVTCLAVFGCMLIVEGWQGHLRTETITVLDQGAKRATTIGWTAFYSPLTPGDGLHFSRGTELAPQRAEPWGVGTAFSMDWTRDQHLTRGWVVARVPAHFVVRKSETRHERVTLTPSPDGGWTMLNGLGEDVHQFWFADRAGNLYRADMVPAGRPAVLTRLGETALGNVGRLQKIYQSEWLDEMRNIPRSPARVLAPGTYLAVLDASPFLEDGLRHARTRKYRALVLGILEAADAR